MEMVHLKTFKNCGFWKFEKKKSDFENLKSCGTFDYCGPCQLKKIID